MFGKNVNLVKKLFGKMPFGKTMFGKNFEFLPDFPEFTSVF
jgi:hypothetical protein